MENRQELVTWSTTTIASIQCSSEPHVHHLILVLSIDSPRKILLSIQSRFKLSDDSVARLSSQSCTSAKHVYCERSQVRFTHATQTMSSADSNVTEHGEVVVNSILAPLQHRPLSRALPRLYPPVLRMLVANLPPPISRRLRPIHRREASHRRTCGIRGNLVLIKGSRTMQGPLMTKPILLRLQASDRLKQPVDL